MGYKIIFINSVARAGKDELADALISQLAEYGQKFKKVKLATTLKSQIDAECCEKFGISAFTENTEEKKIIRPFIVEASKKRRFESNGSYYFMEAMKSIEFNRWKGFGTIVPDLRYLEYSQDEAVLAKKFGGKIITLDRPDVEPANEEEKINFPRIKAISDMVIQSEFSNNPKEKARELSMSIIKQLSDNGYFNQI